MGSWVASACVAQPWWLVWPTRPDPSWIPDGGWPMPRSGARPQPGQGPVLARHCHLPAALNTTAQVPGCTLRGMHEAHCPCWGGGGVPKAPQKVPKAPQKFTTRPGSGPLCSSCLVAQAGRRT